MDQSCGGYLGYMPFWASSLAPRATNDDPIAFFYSHLSSESIGDEADGQSEHFASRKDEEYIDAQVAGGDFADADDYVRELVRRDQERRIQELRLLIDESRASGISTKTTDEIFAEAIEITKARGTYRD